MGILWLANLSVSSSMMCFTSEVKNRMKNLMGVLHSSASDERPDSDVKWLSYYNKLFSFLV